VTGIFKLAYKLLVNDKAKFTALLVGITFAVFLIIQMTAMFAGTMKRASQIPSSKELGRRMSNGSSDRF